MINYLKLQQMWPRLSINLTLHDIDYELTSAISENCCKNE